MFKDNLKNAMELKDINATELSYKTYISRKTIQNYLGGYTEPTVSLLNEIAEAIGVSPLALVSREEYLKRLKLEEMLRGLKLLMAKLSAEAENESVVNRITQEEKKKIVNELRKIVERAEA